MTRILMTLCLAVRRIEMYNWWTCEILDRNFVRQAGFQ